ncbi:MAG: DUF4258 domain-containing protein [Dehalococcoidia bacterium]|nr:DUF4258 domain-containing protein [Dehalococcoidia bacterium]
MADVRGDRMAQVARAVAAGRYRYTYHGAQQRIARRIQRDDVETALANGAVIEDYPDHRFGPACLVLGRAASGEPLHVVCSLREIVDIIYRLPAGPGGMGAGLPHKEVAMTQASADRCSVCGARLKAQHISYTQELDGQVFIVREAPADVYPKCGEQYLAPGAVDAIQELIEHGGLGRAAEITHVPVYRFPQVATGR